MKTRNISILLFIITSVAFSGCNIKNKKTTISIIDPERHYYPILRGQSLDIQYEIENTGNHPLFITDIYTSCGCILVDESSFKVLPSGGKGFIILKYDSGKNVGHVKQYVTILANLEEKGMYEITFDVNVVPNAAYTRDYEEIYNDKKEKSGGIKTVVDGRENRLGYYTDNDLSGY